MAYSIYDIADAQSISKPSDLMEVPDYYLQDVFFMTRPEVFNFDNLPGEGDPYYKNYRDDEIVRDKEFSDFKHTHNPHNWTQQEPVLVNPYKRYDLNHVISSYRMLTNPIDMELIYRSFGDRSAANLEDLLRATSRFSSKYAKLCTVRKLKEDKKTNTWYFIVKGNKIDSNARGHEVQVQLERNPKQVDFRKLKVKISCSCPFWVWWGPDYNADHRHYLLGNPLSDGSAPNKNDPTRKNLICKHVYSVGQIFEKFAKRTGQDTYKEVDSILDNVEKGSKELDKTEMKDIQEISKYLKPSDRRELNPYIQKFYREPSMQRKAKIREDAIVDLADILSLENKSFLRKLLTIVVGFDFI